MFRISKFPIYQTSEIMNFWTSGFQSSKVLTGVASTCKTRHSTCKTSVFRFSEFSITQIPDFPNVRISADFPISEYPIFRFSDDSVFPIFRISDFFDFPIFQFCNFPIRYLNFRFSHFSDCKIFRFSDITIFQFSDFPTFQFSDFQNF